MSKCLFHLVEIIASFHLDIYQCFSHAQSLIRQPRGGEGGSVPLFPQIYLRIIGCIIPANLYHSHLTRKEILAILASHRLVVLRRPKHISVRTDSEPCILRGKLVLYTLEQTEIPRFGSVRNIGWMYEFRICGR